MRLKFFTISVLGPEAATEEFNAFVAEHRVLSIDRRLIDAGAASGWSVCVTYVAPEQLKSRIATPKKGRVDYREVLFPEDLGAGAARVQERLHGPGRHPVLRSRQRRRIAGPRGLSRAAE